MMFQFVSTFSPGVFQLQLSGPFFCFCINTHCLLVHFGVFRRPQDASLFKDEDGAVSLGPDSVGQMVALMFETLLVETGLLPTPSAISKAPLFFTTEVATKQPSIPGTASL